MAYFYPVYMAYFYPVYMAYFHLCKKWLISICVYNGLFPSVYVMAYFDHVYNVLFPFCM